MNPTRKNDNSTNTDQSAAIADPWFIAAQSAKPLIPQWQFSLDPSHELVSQPPLATISGARQGRDTLLAPGKYAEANMVAFLVEEALKLPATSGQALRDAIRDAIAYLELSQAEAS